MKTTKSKIEASAPANVRPSYSVPKTDKQAQEQFIKRCENRRMTTETVLKSLRMQFPKQYELAEVVGKWIWLECPAKSKRLASALWLLGFHWNERRGVWQHPCGKFDPLGSHPSDPRQKYCSYFPANGNPA